MLSAMNAARSKKVLLYLCYWGLSDGLTQATAIPNLKLLLASEQYRRIVFVTIERDACNDFSNRLLPPSEKLVHFALKSRNLRPSLLNKVNDFLYFPKVLNQLIEREQVAQVIARGAPAGALLYKVCKKKDIPLYVESFEPHAEYMLESGVWQRWDPRYLFEKRWEKATCKMAAGLMPVADNYQRRLVAEGIAADKICTVPCAVNLDLFCFDAGARSRVRQHLQIPPHVPVAIYVGKYGGTYYNSESFYLYQQLFAVCSDLYLIILSPDEQKQIWSRIAHFKLPADRTVVCSVPHNEVASYLSAADFGLATVKPTPSKQYCSAIKVGEYWACGLPVLITPGIGDDSDFIEKENIGVVLATDWMQKDRGYFKDVLSSLLQQQTRKCYIQQIALDRRSLHCSTEAYRHFGLL